MRRAIVLIPLVFLCVLAVAGVEAWAANGASTSGADAGQEVTTDTCRVRCESQVRGNPLMGGTSPALDWVVLGFAVVLFYAVGFAVFRFRIYRGADPLSGLVTSLGFTAFLSSLMLPVLFGYRGVAMVSTESGPVCWCDLEGGARFMDYARQFYQFHWPIWLAVIGGTLVVLVLLSFAFGRRPQRHDSEESGDMGARRTDSTDMGR